MGFQEAQADHVLEVSYQVIEAGSRLSWLTAGSADLTIDFSLISPKGQIIARDSGQRQGSHVHNVDENGTLVLCFDNRRSRIGAKLVNIDIYLYSVDDDDRWGQYGSGYTFSPDTLYQESLESIKSALNRVRDALKKVMHAQVSLD